MAQDLAPHRGFPTSDIDPFSVEYILDPFPFHAHLRDTGRMVWMEKWGVFMAPRYTETVAIVSDYKTFNSSFGVGLSNFSKEKPWRPPSLLLEADPPDHTRRRAVVGRILSAPNLRSFKAIFEKEADALIDKLLDMRDVDAVEDVAQAYVLKVFPDAVGLTPDHRINLLKYGQMVFNAFGPLNEVFEESCKDVGPISTWIMEQCRHENLAPGKLGDQVYQAVAGGQITMEEAPILVRSFLSAGVDTTVDAVGNTLWCFASHPAQWAQFKTAPEAQARTAFEEVLRYEGPFQTFFRTTTQDVEIAGVKIGANEKVLLSTGSPNRDPEKWERPDEFDITRNTMGHVGFGHGIHVCIGQMIARLEVETLITQMARRNVRLEITGTAEHRIHNTLRGFHRLPMRITQG